MIDREAIAERHLMNLKKSAGLLGNGSIKYEYILTQEQLINSYLSRMSDLGYALKVEPKRDRYVLNKEVMRKAIEEASTKALEQFAQQIYVFLDNDVNKLIERNAYNILNDVFSLGTPNQKSTDYGA